MKQLKKTILTLVALLAVTTGAWADETLLLTIESKDYTTFKSGSMTFDDKVTVTFSSPADNDSNLGWYATSTPSLLTVAGTNGYTITSCKFYTGYGPANTGYPVEGKSPSVYLSEGYVYNDANQSENIGAIGIKKIEVYGGVASPASSGPEVAWDKATKTGTFKMPGGNVTLEPEYFPQAALTAAPTAINDVPATTDGAIVKAGTVANIGSTETAQGTVMYYVSPTALDDAALLALAADKWTADVPTAEKLTKGQAYVYYYVRGNDSDTDEENFSDGDILAANALTVTIAAEPTKVTLAANDKTMGTVEVAGESKVEWTADTWKGWTADTKVYTVDDITMTSSESGHIREYTSEDKYNNSLFFFVRKMVNDATVTFSTTGDPFSRIEFTMIGDYPQYNPDIIPNDNWTFEGKSAVWEGEATKSLTLQSCSTNVSKITFFKGAIPDGVTVNGDGTFTVAKTATVTLKATPAEGYKFLYWEDDQTNTNPVRKVTIESGMADMTYKAVFAEITYNVTFAEGTDRNEWTASPNTGVTKGQTVTVTYTGSKKVIGVKAEKKAAPKTLAEATLEDIGKIAGKDGKIYATKADAEAVATGNAVAMIAYVGTASDCAHGLAIALEDVSNEKLTWDNSGSNNESKTAAEWCSAWNTSKAVTGGTWRLPSIKDWQYMFIGCGASESYSDNPIQMSYSGLASKLTTAQGDALPVNKDYWSSTVASPSYPWTVRFGDSYAFFGNNTWEGHAFDLVRACLAF